jgi:hypothetical protein
MDRELICRLKSVKRVMMMQTGSCSCFECQNRHVRFRYRQFLTHSLPGARQLPWISTVRLTLTLLLGGPRNPDRSQWSPFWRQLFCMIDRGGGRGALHLEPSTHASFFNHAGPSRHSRLRLGQRSRVTHTSTAPTITTADSGLISSEERSGPTIQLTIWSEWSQE